MFDINKCRKDDDGNLLAQTRDGRPVTIIATWGRGRCPVLGYVGESESLYEWSKTGLLNGCGRSSEFDLTNIPEPKQSGEVWVDVYEDAGTITCGVRTNSSGQSQWSKRLACVRVPWTEGEGLEGK